MVRYRQTLALFTLTAQNTALVLVTKHSYRETATPYIVSTCVCCSEALKLLMSCVLILRLDGKAALSDAFSNVIPNGIGFAVPSFLYVIQNNLTFQGVRLLSPTVYVVLSQAKILSSAFFSVTLLKRRISRLQHLALLLLVAGMILVHTASHQPSLRTTADSTGKGVVFVLAAAITSGIAGTLLEKMYSNSNSDRSSIWVRNAQLACFSLPLAIFATYCTDRLQLRDGIFQGYDAIVAIVILLQALGGLAVAAVLRYAGNVMKCFAVSSSICASAVLSSLLGQKLVLSTSGVIGTILVIASTFLYSTNSPQYCSHRDRRG